MKVYISGPIADLPVRKAVYNFEVAERVLVAMGHEPVNPAKLPPFPGTPGVLWTTYLRKDIKAMMDCEAIFLLRGWSESRGAKLELSIAHQLSFEVMYASGAEYEQV